MSTCRYSSSVERKLPKLDRRVRLPLPAPNKRAPHTGCPLVLRAGIGTGEPSLVAESNYKKQTAAENLLYEENKSAAASGFRLPLPAPTIKAKPTRVRLLSFFYFSLYALYCSSNHALTAARPSVLSGKVASAFFSDSSLDSIPSHVYTSKWLSIFSSAFPLTGVMR